MCLEESFCPFTRDALNFRPLKIYAAPPSSVQVSLSSLRRVTLRSIFCSVTAHAHWKSRVRSNNAPTGNFYVEYLFLFAVSWYCAVTCCSTAVLVNAGQISFSDLLPLCSADNNSFARVFIFFYMFTWCFFTQTHHFYSFSTDLRDLMSINSYCAIISLYEWIAERFRLLHTHWSARDARGDLSVCSLNEDINTRTTSPELLWESLHEHLTVSFE